MKPKVIKKLTPTKTAAKRLWPWFSFIFVNFLLVALFVIAGSGFLFPKQAFAIVYQPQDITVHLDSYTPGQNGQYKPDNLIQVGKGTSSVTIQAQVTLLAPQAGLVTGTDTFDMNTADTASNGQKTGGDTITGIGAGLDKMGQGTNAGGVDCNVQNLINITTSNYQFLTCHFKTTGGIITGAMAVNATIRGDLVVKFSDYDLDVNNTSTLQRIIIYPFVQFKTGAQINNFLVNPTGGFPIYVQFYNSQADANAAIANNQRPSGAPAYGGGTTSSGQANPAGGALSTFINNIIGTLLAIIQFAIYGIFAYLISPIIVAVLSIHAYQDSFVAVIYSGWETIRNLCDIFFIVALIIIAMATLFRVESYKARHLLVQLIIAALLINFSLVIAQAVLAVADTVQGQFLPASTQTINGLAIRLMATNNTAISAWFQTPGIFNSNGTTATSQAVNGSLFGGLIASLFWLCLSLGSFAVFCAIAAFLVIRIVALWLLLMISPMAYAVGVLPSTAHYRDEWWKNFLKYAFFTPIMAFFLNMAAIMASNAQNNPVLQQAANDAGLGSTGGVANLVVTVGSNILLLVFLIAALKVADLAGIYGAQGITDLAKKGIFAPLAGAAAGIKVGTGFAAQKFHKATGIELRPSEWKQAYETYKKKRIAEDKQIGGERAEERREHGSEFLAKLGSPEDFFRTFLNPREWGRMARGGQRRALRSYHDASKIEDELENEMSATNKAEKEAEIRDLEARIRANDADLTSGRFNIDQDDGVVGAKNRSDIGKFIALMEDKARSLTQEGNIEAARQLSAGISKLKKDVNQKDPSDPAGLRYLKSSINLSDYYINSGNPTGVQEAMEAFTTEEKKDQEAEATALRHEIATKRVLADAAYTAKLESMYSLRRKGDELRSPEAYEHRLERLHLESEESGKLKGIDNAEQLNALLTEAIRSKNKFRSAAIMKKMAEDYNDNEYLNLTINPRTGLSYGSGAEGMKEYMHDVLMGKLGMDEQSALQLSDEIAYINEKKNHWENARTVGYKNGKLEYHTQKDHTIAAMIEITKRGPRDTAREFNRLAIGSEIQHPDGHREFKLEKLGVAYAKIVGAQLHSAGQMGFMTGSMLRRFAENQDVLRANGVPEAVIQDMVSRSKVAELDPIDVIKKAHL